MREREGEESCGCVFFMNENVPTISCTKNVKETFVVYSF